MPTPKLTGINALEQWFKENNYPYWVIYNGASRDKKFLFAENKDIGEMDEAWTMLHSRLQPFFQSLSTSTFLIITKPSYSSSSTYSVMFNIPGQNYSTGQMHGIHGPGYGMNQGILGPSGIQGYINSQIQQAVSQHEKDRKIEDLEWEIEELKKGEGTSRFIHGLLEELRPHLGMILKNVLQSNPNLIQGNQHDTTKADETEAGEVAQDAQERLHSAFGKINQANFDVIATVEKVASLIEENPELARQYLNS